MTHLYSHIYFIFFMQSSVKVQFSFSSINMASHPWKISNFTMFRLLTSRAPFQYPTRRLFVRSHEVSKLRDLYLELFDCSEIWQAPWQQCCRGTCQMSEQCDNSNYQSRGFRDFTRSYDKTSYWILKRGPDHDITMQVHESSRQIIHCDASKCIVMHTLFGIESNMVVNNGHAMGLHQQTKNFVKYTWSKAIH